jgi:regulator of replication initiation timing
METTQNNNNNGSGILKAALAVAMLFIGFLGYLLYDSKKTNTNQEQVISQKVEQLATTKSRLDSVGVQLDAKIAEIKSLGGRIDELVAAKDQLEKDKKSLKNAKFFNQRQYDAKINEYVALLSEKDAVIAQLKTENENLTAQTVTLGKEKEVLVQEKQTFIEENTGLKTEREKLTQTVADYTTKNEELTKKVRTGAQLKATNMQVYAVTSKGKVKDGGKYRAKKVDQLKLAFTLPANSITEQENKEILVRIMDADGAVITDSATGSSVFNFDGKEMAYTTKGTVAYTNNDQNVEMLYARGTAYRPGTYNVELYSEGFKIGQSSFTIK